MDRVENPDPDTSTNQSKSAVSRFVIFKKHFIARNHRNEKCVYRGTDKGLKALIVNENSEAFSDINIDFAYDILGRNESITVGTDSKKYILEQNTYAKDDLSETVETTYATQEKIKANSNVFKNPVKTYYTNAAGSQRTLAEIEYNCAQTPVKVVDYEEDICYKYKYQSCELSGRGIDDEVERNIPNYTFVKTFIDNHREHHTIPNIDYKAINTIVVLGHGIEADKVYLDSIIKECTNLKQIVLFTFENESKDDLDRKIKFLKDYCPTIDIVKY